MLKKPAAARQLRFDSTAGGGGVLEDLDALERLLRGFGRCRPRRSSRATISTVLPVDGSTSILPLTLLISTRPPGCELVGLAPFGGLLRLEVGGGDVAAGGGQHGQQDEERPPGAPRDASVSWQIS